MADETAEPPMRRDSHKGAARAFAAPSRAAVAR